MRLSEPTGHWSPARRYTLAALALLALLLLMWLALRPPAYPPMPDMRAIGDVDARKQAFYGHLLPLVRDANATILRDRERLRSIASRQDAGEAPSWQDRRWLEALCGSYGVAFDPEQLPAVLDTLLRRVDIVPPALALAQAAKESGWGRSRFAVQANNLFGQWCYQPGCGIVPARRAAGARHEIQAFDSIAESIRQYMNNLNTHDRYRPFRDLRAGLRSRDKAVTGPALVAGLSQYSQRRDAYVEEIRALMRQNADLLEAVADT
ncbi:glucosaminidase domain-containing protein [Parahaliea mediterranea]|uniref:Glucosaminidase domain-containing protein n=1 Tax=Parahaliea mediterranea TaxID=651086 RepID=A0A939DGN4_9GAMM|nr:glucosaminidase domain-containing protein [Parahaliea mediterranea]MBN7797826.1 glucosaminidase domain-containing protein [Parahaliea mediterranea]